MSKPKSVLTYSGKTSSAITVTNGHTSAGLSLTPAVSNRMNKMQQAFEFYRFTKLRISVPTPARFETTFNENTSSSLYAMGWYPDQTTVGLTGIGIMDVAELDCSFTGQMSLVCATSSAGAAGAGGWNQNLVVVGDTRPRVWSVPRKVLLGSPVKWYRTNSTASAEDLDTVQGVMFLTLGETAGANTVVVAFDLFYTIEFCGAAYSADLTRQIVDKEEEKTYEQVKADPVPPKPKAQSSARKPAT